MKAWLILALLISTLCVVAVSGKDRPKTLMEIAPRSTKVPEASRRHLGGSGVLVIEIDRRSGRATSVRIERTTGHRLLDESAINGLQKWRCKPWTVSHVAVPITFSATDDAARY
jgi:TonB family protein